MALEMVAEMRPREREQHVMNERDRRGGAFDVEQDRGQAPAGQIDGHMPAPRPAAGKYIGPKQTGWNPLSTPLCV